VLVGKPEGKSPLGRPRRKWEDNIKRDRQEVGGDSDVDGRIILRGIFRKWEGIVETGWSGLRIGTGGGHL
jgi:hypothetical protein